MTAIGMQVAERGNLDRVAWNHRCARRWAAQAALLDQAVEIDFTRGRRRG